MFGKRKIDWRLRGHQAGEKIKLAASQLVTYLLEQDEKINKNKLAGPELLSFTSAFFYVIIDREAFGQLDVEERKNFSDGMLEEIAIGLSQLWKEPKQILSTVINVLNNDISKLAPYTSQLIPDKGEDPKGTLYWEFSKLLNSDYGIDTVVTLSSYGVISKVAGRLHEDTKQFMLKTSKG